MAETLSLVAAGVSRPYVAEVFRTSVRYEDVRPVQPAGVMRGEEGSRRVVAVAGIARPERFFAALRERGFDVVREMVFRDHHWFTRGRRRGDCARGGRRRGADAGRDDGEGCDAARPCPISATCR